MRFAAAFALLALLSTGDALAHERVSINAGDWPCCNDPVRWSARHDANDARIAITTEDGKVTLLLTREVVAVQLSDRTMRKLDRELRDARREGDDGVLGEAIKAAVLGGVRALLDHSAECPVREIRDVSYAGGRLVITARDGGRVFDGFEVDDDDLLTRFERDDALAFVREFRRVKGARR